MSDADTIAQLRADVARLTEQACPNNRATCVSDNWNAGFREAETRYQPLLEAARAENQRLTAALMEALRVRGER